MRILVTGANGFLGRHVVAALRSAGHDVRALVRPTADLAALDWSADIEIVRADLASTPDLGSALEGVDAVIHLAAAMRGSAVARFEETTAATERLLDAMGRTDAKIHRLVLCSSFSVYDWSSAQGTVDEALPLASKVAEDRGYSEDRGYAAAKLNQERMARGAAEANGWELTILRPGFVWGLGNEIPAGSLGLQVGRLHLVFAPGRQLPFTHVDNCADCFRVALESDRAAGAILNVVDGFELTPWRFLGEAIRCGAASGLRIGVPHLPLRILIGMVRAVAGIVPGLRPRLPALFESSEFAQRFRPLRYSTRNLEQVLGWRPPIDFDSCIARTFRSADTPA